MVDSKDPRLSISRQCRLLDLPRSSFYYHPTEESAEDLTLMRLIDGRYLAYPFYGSRRTCDRLRDLGFCVGRKRVRQLMAKMGLRAVSPRPRTSRSQPEHRIFPYLLRDVSVTHPDQCWCADLERHEALSYRVEVKGRHRRAGAAARVKLGAAWPWTRWRWPSGGAAAMLTA